MSDRARKVYLIIIVGSFALILFFLAILPSEGTTGLWRRIVLNMLAGWGVAIVGLAVLEKITGEDENPIILIGVWITGAVLAGVLSIPVISDFSAEHKVIEVLSSSCDEISTHGFDRSHYLVLDTGERIEISSNTYFDLLGQNRCTLRIEYYPNTKVAVSISGYVKTM
jgi:hypothetical protein